MAVVLPPVPKPPSVQVQRYTADGRPTQAQVTYESQMQQYLLAVKTAIEGM